MTHRDDHLYEAKDLYPIYKAKEPEEIALVLQDVLERPAAALEMGQHCRKWYEESVINPIIDRYERFIVTGDPE